MVDIDEQKELQKAIQAVSEQQLKLLEQQQQLLAQMAASSKGRQKDIWDRLGAIAPVLSGTIIALGGTFFTLSYNEQQLKLQEAQTIERFIPHLLGDEKSKRAAILAISSITGAKMAAKIASIFASPGTVSALESLAENGTTTDRKTLKCALAKAMDNMAGNYVAEKRYDDAIVTSRKALSLQEQSFGAGSPELVSNLNRLAELCTINKDLGDAESYLKRSTEIQKTSFGADSTQFASQLRRLSVLYKEQGLDSKSQSILNQALAIEQKSPLTASGAGGAVSPDGHIDHSDHVSAGPDASAAANTDKSSHGSESSGDLHNGASDSDSALHSPSESGSSRASGSDHGLPGDGHVLEPSGKGHSTDLTGKSHAPDTSGKGHSQDQAGKSHAPDTSGKAYNSTENDSERLHDGAATAPARLEKTGERQH